jgi:hypothetical protein
MLVLTLAVVACASPPSDSVLLVTGAPMGMSGDVGCYTDSASGPLVTDPRYGTAIIDRGGMNQQTNIAVPVAWRPGFSGRRAGSELEVLDPAGNVVAVTGRDYVIQGGGVTRENWPGLPTTGAFWACGFVQGG